MERPIELTALTSHEVAARARECLPRGYGAAFAIYRDALTSGRFAPEQHGLSPAVAQAWREAFRFEIPSITRTLREPAEDQEIVKAVIRLGDGLECESVLLPMGRGRTTLCISSQVGCKMGCTFCETGRMGLLRNLSVPEIIGQVLAMRHGLGLMPRNLVFMGMGEALDNFDALVQALRVLTDPSGLAIAQERITVCTVGRLDGIRKLAALGFKRLNLSVSLNAPTDALRRELMPVARTSSLLELQSALVDYRPRRNFALGVNYCLLPGINDAREHAAGVARFCEPLERVMVNVIPYNPGSKPLAPAPSEEQIDQFIGWLRDEGLPVRRRITKGRTVMAACGQLGNVEQAHALRPLRRAR